MNPGLQPQATSPRKDQTTPAPQSRAVPATAVVGLQWGDEGKGKVIDVLAENHDTVVRFNGGANAGHSIVIAGERFAVHLIPSGVFNHNTESFIAGGVVVDTWTLVRELDQLAERGISIPLGHNDAPRNNPLYIAENAHLVLPYHKAEDALLEAWLSGSGKPIGTTGRGIGPAYADKAMRSLAIRVADLSHPDRLTEKLHAVCAWKRAAFDARAASINADPPEPACTDADAIADDLARHTERLRPAFIDATHALNQRINAGKRLLFEGANATLLDIDHGTYPFVTSSNTTAAGIAAGAGVPPCHRVDTVGVAKAYSTRVGEGPMPTELTDATADTIRDRGNEYGTTTGRPRRCGWIDLVALRYATMINGCASVALMLLDVLTGFDELKVCTAYTLPDGSTTNRFTTDPALLSAAKPVYETLPGFHDDITAARSLHDLPTNARRYLATIEEAVGVPVSIVSVGPGREQTIHV